MTLPFDSRIAYLALIGLVVVERMVELVISERHRRSMLARGGREVGQGHYPAMVVVHGGLLVGAPLEVWVAERPVVPWLAVICLATIVATMVLRYWVVATLGERWCTRVVTVPGEPRIVAGPFRYLSHPNYLAVVLEVAALPLVHTAWVTALVATLANAAVLTVRIRVENRALGR